MQTRNEAARRRDKIQRSFFLFFLANGYLYFVDACRRGPSFRALRVIFLEERLRFDGQRLDRRKKKKKPFKPNLCAAPSPARGSCRSWKSTHEEAICVMQRRSRCRTKRRARLPFLTLSLSLSLSAARECGTSRRRLVTGRALFQCFLIG